MKLTQSGTIKVDGYNARRTDEGDWHVSRFETSLGYVDSVDEIQGLITRHKEKVRSRLARAQRKANERREDELRELWGDAESAFDRGDYEAGNKARMESIALETGLSENMIRAHNITGEGPG